MELLILKAETVLSVIKKFPFSKTLLSHASSSHFFKPPNFWMEKHLNKAKTISPE